jgi:exopolyphosphatase/guanosine-5'-triphosphate,3'-diphosphate pyrophosphatase
VGSGTEGLVAAIDCGTNSTRLLVADSRGRSIERVMRITRLGQGVDATRRLSSEAMSRTLDVLSEFRRTMDGLGVKKGRLVATSAVRDAVNGDQFLRDAAEVTGLPAELLSGDEEGRIAYAGAVTGLPPAAGDDVVVDIGGGSTELVLARHGRISAVSLDLGCVRLTERYLSSDPPGTADMAIASGVIEAELDRACGTVPGLTELAPSSRLIGLAGTVATLSILQQGLLVYERAQVHHSILSRRAVDQWLEILAGESASERGLRAGIDFGRQDVIVGGVLELSTVMHRFGFDECLVSESDILDGLIGSLLGSMSGSAGGMG